MRYRLISGLLGLLFSTASLQAQSSVWKITRGGHTLYLGGTCHVLRAGDFPLPPEFDTAFAASSKVYFETDIGRMTSPEAQALIVQNGRFADGNSLQKVLKPETWKRVQEYCAKSSLPLEVANQFKPWLFTVTMAVLELQKIGVSTQGVDLHYYKKASDAGKQTGQLETFEHHIQYLFNLGAGQEDAMIASSMEELGEIPALMKSVLGAWKSGDVAKIDELLLHDVRTKYPAVYRSLFVARNNAWIPKIEELVKTADVEFVLVGAGHMAGKEGLLAQLRARGYAIEQIKAAPARKR